MSVSEKFDPNSEVLTLKKRLGRFVPPQLVEVLMLVIPDYLIYDELKRREERDVDGGLQPLHLPLYEPELEEAPRNDREDEDAPSRGVIIIDMNSWEEEVD